MAKSTYCERYTHQLCVKHGKAEECDCNCHKSRENVDDVDDYKRAALDANILPQPEPSPELREYIAKVDDVDAADAEVMRFAESLKNRKRKDVTPAQPEGSLDAIAQRFLNVLYGIDPTWEERDRACAAEWALSPAQRLLKYAGMVLDQQLHLNMLQGYEFLEPGAQPRGTPQQPEQLVTPMRAECPQCHNQFDRKIPGQITCSNECGDLYFPKPKRKEPEFDDEFSRFIESQRSHPEPQPDDVRNDRAIPTAGVLR